MMTEAQNAFLNALALSLAAVTDSDHLRCLLHPDNPSPKPQSSKWFREGWKAKRDSVTRQLCEQALPLLRDELDPHHRVAEWALLPDVERLLLRRSKSLT